MVYDESNTPELPNSGIVNLHWDRTDCLWVSTIHGMAVLADGQWHTWQKKEGWSGDFARTITERSPGELLITTFDGHVLEFVEDRFPELPTPPGEPGLGYLGFVDAAGRWGVAQNKFVGYWDGRHWQATFVPTDVAADRVAVAPSRRGGHWLLLGNDLLRLEGGALVVQRTVMGLEGGMWSIFEDSSANLWLCSYNKGLYRVDPQGELRHWTTEEGLTSNGVRYVFEEREGNLWIGTSGGGLMQLVARRAREFGRGEGLTGRVVNSVSLGSDGSVWFATYDQEVFCWDDSTLSPVVLEDPLGRATLAQSVLADSSGCVWVGTYGEGLWRIEGGQTTRIPEQQAGDRNILALFEDSRGDIWFGGGDRMSRLQASRFEVFGLGIGVPAEGATCFAEDREGTIWMANRPRVLRFQRDGLHEILDPRGNSIQGVSCLRDDGAEEPVVLASVVDVPRRDFLVTRIKPIIAIVDDDASVCRSLKRLIRSFDMEAEAFSSGEEYVERVEATPAFHADCLVLDLQMPGMSGLEVQSRIADHGIPMILISAHDDPAARERALAAGAVAFLRKPLDESLLWETINTAVLGR